MLQAGMMLHAACCMLNAACHLFSLFKLQPLARSTLSDLS
jgi:hypothetical protein